MKKRLKFIAILVFITLICLATYNIYQWVVRGEQNIYMSLPNKIYANNDLYVGIDSRDNNSSSLETKSEIKLLNSEKKEIKNILISYEGSNAIISIPNLETGKYFIKAKVSSEKGKDTVEKEIYITKSEMENITISLDKGIYKPGDTVNFRALLTHKNDNTPIEKDVNISIYDGNENRVYNENVKSSDYGIVSGSFTLANEVNSGFYKLAIKTKATEIIKQFKVNPYVTPKYEVKIETNQEHYLVGDNAKIDLSANYFFGEPVSNVKFTVFMNGKELQKITADENGKASLEYKIKDSGKNLIKVEAVNDSNYFIEESKMFTAGTDLFEIEVLPEYGNLIAGKRNDIYIFTKKADGTPIKAYLTVTTNQTTKQVATDENGIGKVSFDFENVAYTKNKKSVSIIAENMEGEKVEKIIYLEVDERELLVSTDKAKYNQNEDITIKVSSEIERNRNIYIVKNDRLLQTINTDSDEVIVNLKDEYGLIDIFVTDANNYYYNYSYYYKNNKNLPYKRTIFIEPKEQLNIAINTEKNEYKPGEPILISFETTNEKEEKVDAALLVSMLDNAILNLADNDLSIDTIKLALSDIKFSDELDAATLYSCIVNDASEETIMALLLKQEVKDFPIVESKMSTRYEEQNAEDAAIISIVCIIMMIVVFLGIKFPKAIKHILNFAVVLFTMNFFLGSLLEEIVWQFEYNWLTFSVISILTFILYLQLISKISEKIFKTTVLIVISILLYFILAILIELLEGFAFLVIALILLLGTILTRIKKLKNTKFVKILKKAMVTFGKFILAVLATVFVIYILRTIAWETVGYLDVFGFEIILLYAFNYLFNRTKKDKEEVKEESATEKSLNILICFFGIVGVIALLGLGVMLYNTSSGVAESTVGSSWDGGGSLDAIQSPNFDINTSGGAINNVAPSGIGNIFDGLDFSKNEGTVESLSGTSSQAPKDEVESVEDTHVRQLFLESMCFIPELVTSNGEVDLDLKLSDNITTWTIQTIGNTKDGKIGYASKNDVKVFKEFFVDFELPKNSVTEDKISIPVTIYNYTENAMTASLKIIEKDWFKLNKENTMSIEIEAQASKMLYIPIEIIEAGNNVFRVEVTSENLTDIVEKSLTVNPKGYLVEKVVSSGKLEDDIEEDILFLEKIVENTASATVKIYAGAMAQTVEGMENIFRMPTGCFEQISSSLYPNILALKYMEENNTINDELKEKALKYISSGYQKLLTYEVSSERGGYSLYGSSPAETVLTAYGLMELTDLSEVYSVDENVLKDMRDFLYSKQNINGSFTITGNHIGGASSREKLALNAYITWALSEANPTDEELVTSVDYLKNNLNDVDDNYTLALIANTLANVNDPTVKNVIQRLIDNVKTDNGTAWVTSRVTDYYGSRGNSQTIQTTALTSMALSKTSTHVGTNKLLINYLVKQKDAFGTWYNTQVTILALKALNDYNEKSELKNQTIKVSINNETKDIEIKDNPLQLYELTFNSLQKENELTIDLEKKSNAYYEVVEKYYVPYEVLDLKNDKIEVGVSANTNLKVNEILEADIRLINRSTDKIYNGMVSISIPQGFVIVEESLMELEEKNIIEKYEMTYTTVNLYLRNLNENEIKTFKVSFRASYPVEITGMATRVYDYYNPSVEGRTMPIKITVK